MEYGRSQPFPPRVARYLMSLVFPCQKEDLIRHAEAHQAEEAVLAILEMMPEGTYGSMADVVQGNRQTERDGSHRSGARTPKHYTGQQDTEGTDIQGPGMPDRGRAVTSQRQKTTVHGQGVTVRGQTRDDAAEFAEEHAALDTAGVPTQSRTGTHGKTGAHDRDERAPLGTRDQNTSRGRQTQSKTPR
jgi:Protein of unknown function (DUF2795)